MIADTERERERESERERERQEEREREGGERESIRTTKHTTPTHGVEMGGGGVGCWWHRRTGQL